MQFTGFRKAILDEAVAEFNIAFLIPVNCILDDPSFNLCYIINPANINEFFSTCGLYVVWLFNSRYKIINLYLENNKRLLITCQTIFSLTDQNRKWHVRRPVIGWFLAIVQYAFFPDPFINMLLYGIVISQSVCCILYLLIILYNI